MLHHKTGHRLRSYRSNRQIIVSSASKNFVSCFAVRNTIHQLQVALTRTHFKFGEEEMDYTTDHQMGFQYDPEKVGGMLQLATKTR